MSSAVYLSFTPPIPLEEWEVFCVENNIDYLPNVIGRNAFYANDGGVQIVFGGMNLNPLPKTPSGRTDFNAARPLLSASEITVSTFWMGKAIPDVARMAQCILSRWHGEMECDPELERFFS